MCTLFLAGCGAIRSFFNQGDEQQIGAEFATISSLTSDPRAAYQLGRYLQSRGKHGLAVHEFEKVVAADPANINAYNAMGVSYDMLGEYQKAAACYRAVLERKPGLGWAHNNLGVSFLMQGRPEEAVGPLARAVELNPATVRFRNNLGLAYASTDRALEAFAQFEKGNGTVEAHKIMAAHYKKTGKSRLAWRHEEMALAMAKHEQAESAPDLKVAQNNQFQPVYRGRIGERRGVPRTLNVAEMKLRDKGLENWLKTPTATVNRESMSPNIDGFVKRNRTVISRHKYVSGNPEVNDFIASPTQNVSGGDNIRLSRTVYRPSKVDRVLKGNRTVIPTKVGIQEPLEVASPAQTVSGGDNTPLSRTVYRPIKSDGLVKSRHPVQERGPGFQQLPRKTGSRIKSGMTKKDNSRRSVAFNEHIKGDGAVKSSAAVIPPEPFNFEPGIELCNGNGVHGIAARLSAYLKSRAVEVHRVTNAEHFSHEKTVIYYRPGYAREAYDLAQELPGLQRRREAPQLEREQLKIRIIIGKDLILYDSVNFAGA
jgi:Flp pilus assembly protein TadD